jgi:hypothetical protein
MSELPLLVIGWLYTIVSAAAMLLGVALFVRPVIAVCGAPSTRRAATRRSAC